MAEKKVAQESCIFCGHNPCDCGGKTSRKRRLRAEPTPVESDPNTEDRESSASRQHFIDTGRYLTYADREENA